MESMVVTLSKELLVEAGVLEAALRSVSSPGEKSLAGAAFCREAISLSGQGKKWGISRPVPGTDFSTGGSSSFSNSSDWYRTKTPVKQSSG